MSRKPDRAERQMAKLFFGSEHGPPGFMDKSWRMTPRSVAKLLRQEHEWMRRMVKAAQKSMCSDAKCPACNVGAMTYILNRLTQRRK